MAGIKIPVSAETKGAESDLANLGATMGGIGLAGAAAFAAVGAAAVAAGIAIFKIAGDVASLGDDFDKMSARTGVSVETLSAMAHVADLAGTDIGALEKALKTASVTIVEADRGTAKYKDALDSLGISTRNSQGELISTDKLLLQVADRFQGMSSATEKAALVQEIFGGKATALIPILDQGSDAIRAQMLEAQNLGIVFTTLSAKEAADFIDAQARIGAAWQGLKNQFAKDIIPVLTTGLEALAALMADQGDIAVAAGVLVVKALGAIVEVFGTAFPFMVQVLDGVSIAWESWKLKVIEAQAAFGGAILKMQEWAGVIFNNEEAIEGTKDELGRLNMELFLGREALGEQVGAHNELVEAARDTGARLRELGGDMKNLKSDALAPVADELEHVAEVMGTLPPAMAIDEWHDYELSLQMVQNELPGVGLALGLVADSMETTEEAMAKVNAELLELEKRNVVIEVDVTMPDPGSIPSKFDVFIAKSVSFMETTGGVIIGNAVAAGIGTALGEGDAIDALTAGLEVGLGALASMVPGFGPILAQFAKPLAGLIGKLIGDAFQKADSMSHVQEQFGLALSDALAAAIDDVQDSVGGNLDAAFRLLMGDAIREGTIETVAELDVWLTRVHQILSSIDEGFLDSKRGVEAMADAFMALIPSVAAAGGSAMDFQRVFSDMITRSNEGGLEMAQVVGTIEDALALMVESGVDGVDELVTWLQTMGVNIDAVELGVQDAAKTWQDAMQVMGVAVAVTTEQITRDQIDAIKTLGLSAETEAALIRGLKREIRQEEKAALAEFKDDLKERAKELNLSQEETREFVKATLKAQRQEERQAAKDAEEDAENKRKVLVTEAEKTRDGILATFAGTAVEIPIALVAGSSGDQRKIVNAFASDIIKEIERRGAF